MIEQTEQTDTVGEQADLVLKKAIGTAAQESTRTAAGPSGAPAVDGHADARPERAAGIESLVSARKALGLGASDIASKLGMATRQIEALERGDWHALPGQAFVRGALRSYGKSVGVDVDPLLASIGGQVLAPELRSSSSLDAAMPHRGTLGFSSGGSGGRLVWIVLGVAAVIAMALYFGDAFEIGPAGGGEQPLASSDAAARSPQSGPTAATASRPAASSPTASQPTASSSGAGGLAASGTSSPVSAGSGNMGSGGSATGGATAPAGGFAQLAPLAPLAPLSPAPAAAGSGATAPANASAAATNIGSGLNGSADPAAPARTDASLAGAAGVQPAIAAATAPGGTATGVGGTAGAPNAAPTANAAAAASAPGTASPSSADALRLQFARESWVDIRDGSGKVLLQGTQPAGSSRELGGAAPFRLVIGNAEHVRLERNGRRVEFGNRTRSGVARLTLD